MDRLDANAAFADTRDQTREDGLLNRIADALRDAGIASGYTSVVPPRSGNNILFIPKEDSHHRSSFNVEVKPGYYSITSHQTNNTEGSMSDYRTPMEPAQLAKVTGQTHDYNTFIGALEYIFAIHYPTAAADGRLTKTMNQFKRPEEPQPASRPTANSSIKMLT